MKIRPWLPIFALLILARMAAPQSEAPALLEPDDRYKADLLLIAAHPDDENTQLIAYLARGRGYRTAYLSLTWGAGP